MSLASVLALVASVIACNVAMLHGWLYALRRTDHAHLWITVTAIGVAGMGAGTAMLYSVPPAHAPDRLQGVLFAFAAPVLTGFYRYSFVYLNLRRNAVLHGVEALSLSVLVLGLWPGAMVSPPDASAALDPLRHAYVRAELTSVGVVLCFFLGVACLNMVVLYARHLDRRDPNRTMLVAVLTIWVATMVSDMMGAFEMHDGPFLIAFGYSAFMAGISSVQIRRMAGSMEAVERVTARLGKLVDRRTSALRRTEIQLAHGAQMATLGTLAASLAHEINNPIAYVSSNLNRVEEGFASPERLDEAEEIDEMLGECQEGIERVRTIVQSLLSLARRSDGIDGPVDLRDLVEATLPVVRREGGRRARLETDLTSSASVRGDPRLLGHVVLSLVMHALDATPSGRPEDHRIRVSTRDDDERVVLTVTDTGKSLSTEEIDDLLGGLLAEGSDRVRSGLGLSVARQIVERHRGRMEVGSGPAGTAIRVMLPALDDEGAPARDAPRHGIDRS